MTRRTLRFLTLPAFLSCVAAAHAAEDTTSLPRLPFPMPAAEYPQEALVANQEGVVVLRATIGTDAKMTNVAVVESSGHPILDDAAVLVLRNAQLSQAPTTPDGQPTSADVMVDATWDLPLESAEEYFPEEFFGNALAAQDAAIVYPVADENNHQHINARDFPVRALRQDFTGIAGLYLHVLEDGSVAEARLVSTSGDESIDEAAVTVAERFEYSPGRVGGAAVEMWVPFEMLWSFGALHGARRFNPCFQMAMVDPYERRTDRDRSDAPRGTPAWIHGCFTDRTGWPMRASFLPMRGGRK